MSGDDLTSAAPLAANQALETTTAENAAGPNASHPARIGSYRVLRLLGEGGMGAVFLAEQEHPKRQVALKVIRGECVSASLLQRFAQETAVLARLQHPGIAQIFEAGTAGEGGRAQPYFAMEFVAGQSLTEFASENKLGTRQRLELLVKVCEAVEHAHQKGVIHRDLKPGNILVDAAGQPKILDFGIARATDADMQTSTLATSAGQLIGTVPYMSPEQAKADPELLDTRSDVYALGVIAYELLAGRLPHDLRGRPLPEALRIILEDEPTPLSSVNKSLRGDLATIVAKALEKEKDRRYQSAADLARDVQRHLRDEPILARPASTWYQASKFARRNKVLVGGIAAVFFAMFAGLASTTWAMRIAQRETTRALGEEEKAKLAEEERAKEAAAAQASAAAARSSAAVALASAAELSTRHGKWKEAIEQFNQAIELGHPDEIGLRIGRLRCYSALNMRHEEVEEIVALMKHSDLGTHAGSVLLEQSLLADLAGSGFGNAVALRHEALKKGLPPADAAFARSYDATTLPDAVARLEEAVSHDPFHNLAHERLLMLYAVTGRHNNVAKTVVALKLLQPDSVKLVAHQAAAAGLAGNAADAEAGMAELERRGAGPEAASLRLVFTTLDKIRDVFNGREAAAELDMAGIFKQLLSVGRMAMSQMGAGASSPEAATGLQTLNYPLFGDIIRHLGACMVYDTLAQRSAAANEFGEIARIMPDGLMLFGHAMLLIKAGRLAEAEPKLVTAAQTPALVPIRRRALFELTNLQLNRLVAGGKPDRELAASALKYARELSQLAPLSYVETSVAARAAAEGGDFPLVLSLLADLERRQPLSVPLLGYRSTAEFQLGAFERCFATAGQILERNGDNAQRLIAGYRAESLARIIGRVPPQFDWLAATKLETARFAAAVKLAGDDKDPNSQPWVAEAVPGSADVLEGNWQARIQLRNEPGAWYPFTAKISKAGERWVIELSEPGDPQVARRIEVRKEGKQLLGWQRNTHATSDASPWVGLMVDGERIDGAMPDGRLDLRRKLAP